MKHRRRRSPAPALITLIALLAMLGVSAFGTVDRSAQYEPVPATTPAPAVAHTETVKLIPVVAQEAVKATPPEVELATEPVPSSEPESDPEPVIDEAELEMLACVIYGEAGGNACSDLARQYVGDVVLNRVADPRFPDTLEGVLLQAGQYGRFHWTGIVWPERAQYEVEAAAVARAYDTARALLSGEHSELYGAGYIWQAEFSQGTDVIYLDGIYFGR